MPSPTIDPPATIDSSVPRGDRLANVPSDESTAEPTTGEADGLDPDETDAGLVQSNVRMPQAGLDYFDAWVKRLNREARWKKFTRSSLIRSILMTAIERDVGATSGKDEGTSGA
jgi:hypothetical protein